MTSPNVAVLQGVYNAFNRRDINALLAGFDLSIEIEETADLGYAALLLRVLGPRFVILSGRYSGREEVRRLFESVWEIAEWFYVEARDYIEIDDHVVVPLHLSARAKDTGIEGNALTAHLWTMEGGKAKRLEVYAGEAQALDAVRAKLNA